MGDFSEWRTRDTPSTKRTTTTGNVANEVERGGECGLWRVDAGAAPSTNFTLRSNPQSTFHIPQSTTSRIVNLSVSAATSSSGRLRVCAVSYLNTVPLVWGMLHGAQRGMFDLEFRVPSECADRLATGEADIGIVPTAELPRLGLELIPGSGIASEGPVRSILLVSKVPLGKIELLAADTSSRTSVALAKILLARKYGAEPRLLPQPPDLARMLDSADAAVIIGDPALHIEPSAVPFEVTDLGAEWTAMTGLPMVFAVWAGRKGCVTPEVARAFTDSRRFGISEIDEIVRTRAEAHGVTRELAREYLTRHIRFELGEREYEGMRRFLQLAADFAIVEPSGAVPL